MTQQESTALQRLFVPFLLLALLLSACQMTEGDQFVKRQSGQDTVYVFQALTSAEMQYQYRVTCSRSVDCFVYGLRNAKWQFDHGGGNEAVETLADILEDDPTRVSVLKQATTELDTCIYVIDGPGERIQAITLLPGLCETGKSMR